VLSPATPEVVRNLGLPKMKLRNADIKGKKTAPRHSRRPLNDAVHQPQPKSTRVSSSSSSTRRSKVVKKNSKSSRLTSTWEVGDAVSEAHPIGPPNYNPYPASRTVWSYEVTTESEIYRISTVPNDFLGNSGDNWPRTLKAAHNDYKVVQAALTTAKANLRTSRLIHADMPAYVDLQKRVYRATYDEAKAREGFLKIWPSAFGWTESLKGHIDWNRNLEREAKQAQRDALERLRE
jgi:hypothetical protein